MTAVIDASVVVAALIDEGPEGRWAEATLIGHPLAAPHLMPAEVDNILRRAARRSDISDTNASLAHLDLLGLRCQLFAYSLFAERIWQLRDTVTSYDAWYVALAETLDAPLFTLDRRLSRAPGPQCAIVTPPQ